MGIKLRDAVLGFVGFVPGFVLGIVIIIMLWYVQVDTTYSVNKAYGFSRIIPFDKSIFYDSETDGLDTTFVNAAGDSITIIDMRAIGDCTPSSFEKMKLKTNQTTRFSYNCTNKREGDRFLVNVEIAYTEIVGNKTVTRTDIGVITGTVE